MGDDQLRAARAVLRDTFGHAEFRPGQLQAVESVLARRNTVVILPTGGGKSLCYQVPALVQDGLTVVLSPLISLMKDQVDALKAKGVAATFVNSSLSSTEVSARLSAAMRGELKLLYVAPERFDFGGTAERLARSGVALLAVDEAHCISEWGHDFRPSYRRVREIHARLGSPPTVALTATATPEVRRDIIRVLALDSPVVVLTGFDRPNLRLSVVPTKTDAEKDATLVELLRRHDGVGIVYASTRKTVDRVAGLLVQQGIAAEAYHAGLDDQRRKTVQASFMRESARVIVATNAFGMGIDKPNVRIVVHHAMPGSLEAYYQEAGRAGRDGQPASCYLLHAFPDRFTHEFFIKGACPERAVVDAIYAAARRSAAPDGLVTIGAAELAARAREKVSSREAESAVRILAGGGALAMSQGSDSLARVRLLATPERIREELGESAASPSPIGLDLLRLLWRASRGSISRGAVVNLMNLPPGFHTAPGVHVLLDALEQRQLVIWERVGEGMFLTDATTALSQWPVDWDTLDRRRRAELAQLDAMQKYAYSKQCRRAFVLRYFGDPSAGRVCAECDNCLGVRQAASAPSSTGRSRARGSANRRRPAESAGDLPALTAAEDAALARLRTLRSTLARTEGVPAYVVFADRTLRDMVRTQPGSLEAMAGVHGVGPAKLERYGRAFLKELQLD